MATFVVDYELMFMAKRLIKILVRSFSPIPPNVYARTYLPQTRKSEDAENKY